MHIHSVGRKWCCFVEWISPFTISCIILDGKENKYYDLSIIRAAADRPSLLQVIVFVGLWIILKIVRGASWSLVDLSQPDKVAKIFRHLHDIRLSATQSDGNSTIKSERVKEITNQNSREESSDSYRHHDESDQT